MVKKIILKYVFFPAWVNRVPVQQYWKRHKSHGSTHFPFLTFTEVLTERKTKTRAPNTSRRRVQSSRLAWSTAPRSPPCWWNPSSPSTGWPWLSRSTCRSWSPMSGALELLWSSTRFREASAGIRQITSAGPHDGFLSQNWNGVVVPALGGCARHLGVQQASLCRGSFCSRGHQAGDCAVPQPGFQSSDSHRCPHYLNYCSHIAPTEPEIQGLGAAIAQEGADPGPSLAVLKVIEEEKLMHNVHRWDKALLVLWKISNCRVGAVLSRLLSEVGERRKHVGQLTGRGLMVRFCHTETETATFLVPIHKFFWLPF